MAYSMPDQRRDAAVIDELNIFPAEVLTSLRRMLTLQLYQQSLPRSMSVVAALRREGVTFTTLAMGALLASDMAARVCAVDLNWEFSALFDQCQNGFARPPAPRRDSPKPAAAPPPRPGIAEVLSGALELDEATTPTVLPSFHVLGPGQIPQQRWSLIARSQELRALIEELGQRYDYVLLDVPALLHTSDAIALASLGEACCLVVRQGVTPTSMVKSALDELKHKRMFGVILNRVQIHTPKLLLNFVPQE